ncbi:penicillin-binding protein activator [Rickettsiaceae bacterium]|nr:penicillin-binding protein activator [Rickettsiaceae bacterium]
MLNIKQKLIKFTLSFVAMLTISACDQIKDFSSLKNVMGKNVIDVAILLPMSGPEAELSKEYAQMIKIGLSDSAQSKIRVTTYDSSSEKKLTLSLDKILEKGTDIIVGPIYSRATKEVAKKVKGKGTIVLSLSNNPVLADNQVFVYGHAPMRQLEKLTNHFLDNEYKNYIALLPAGRYSSSVSKILQSMITSRDATLARIEFYGNAPEDIERAISVVSNNVDSLNENAFNIKKPVILIADDAATLELMYGSVRKYNLDKKAIIAGDSRADIDYSEPVDITFTGSLNITDTNLTMRSMKAGISHISFMHAVSYDAGKMLGTYIGQTYNKNRLLNRMNAAEPFIGISGSIYFVDSIAQRNYDIISKDNGKYINISKPAIHEHKPGLADM